MTTIAPATMTVRRIPLTEPYLGGNERAYLMECIATGFVSSVGPFVTRFEEQVAAITGRKHAVATMSGTAALHLALLAVGVTRDDVVVVPSVTFVAPVNAVTYCGALPIFMDVEPQTLCLDTSKTIEYFARACVRRVDGATVDRVTGRRVAAVVAVDVFGHPADYDPLAAACRTRGIPIVADACESLGSQYRGRPAGSIGDIAALSFNGNKIATAGGGGAVCTDREDWARDVRHRSTQAKSDPVAYDHDVIGYNYRLTNIQAAVGCAQLEQLNAALAAKRHIAARYAAAFADIPGVAVYAPQPWASWNCWLPGIAIAPDRVADCIAQCRATGIEVRPAWRPIPLLPMYRDCPQYRIEHAFDAAAAIVNLPSSVGLTAEDQEYVMGTIRSVLRV